MDSGRSSLDVSGLDSSQALILVNDDEDMSSAPFEFYSDDEDDFDSPFDSGHRPYVQPLLPSSVFAYLLAPYLKLGATLLPYSGLPLKYGIPALVVFAVLSALSRHLWYRLARYARKSDLEDIVADVLARGRGKEDQRDVLRSVIRGVTGTLRVALSALYLRESVNLLLPFIPADLPIDLPVEPLLSITLGFLMLPFTLGQTLASRRVRLVTWLSIGTYIAWFGCSTYAYTHGILKAKTSWMRLGAFWQGITTTAFVFATGSTLSLYSALKASSHEISTTKTSTPRSFKTLSMISIAVALSLTIPLAWFAASPNQPLTKKASSSYLEPASAALNALSLLLYIPSIIISTPLLPIPERIRRSSTIPISKLLIFTVILLLSIVPESAASVLSDVVLVLALTSTFSVPAFLHIATHFVRRPLSIIIPTSPNPLSSPTEVVDQDSPPNSASDPLLQRKETALQRRQLRRRIIWDVSVWLALVPLTVSGFAWAIGTLVGKF